jgi:hypothetical protein
VSRDCCSSGGASVSAAAGFESLAAGAAIHLQVER